MHTLFGITLVLYLLKLSAGKVSKLAGLIILHVQSSIVEIVITD